MQVTDAMVDAALDAHHAASLAISSDPFEAMRAALDAALAESSAEREDGVNEILKNYRAFISDRPALLSLLYDIDMMPEQTVTRAGAIRLAGLCAVWKKGESGELPPPPMGK